MFRNISISTLILKSRFIPYYIVYFRNFHQLTPTIQSLKLLDYVPQITPKLQFLMQKEKLEKKLFGRIEP